MKEKNLLNLACRHCRHYQPEGRRGGSCHKLGVAVDSDWKACVLAASPFDNSLTNLDRSLTTLNTTLTSLEEIVHLETAFSLSFESYDEEHTEVEKETVEDYLISNHSNFK